MDDRKRENKTRLRDEIVKREGQRRREAQGDGERRERERES